MLCIVARTFVRKFKDRAASVGKKTHVMISIS